MQNLEATWNSIKMHLYNPPSYFCSIWAPSSEFVSSSIPSWQILTPHTQPFRGARDLAFCLKVPLDSLLIWASSEGSGETARMRRLVCTFAAHIVYKYQIRLTRSILFIPFLNEPFLASVTFSMRLSRGTVYIPSTREIYSQKGLLYTQINCLVHFSLP